jgi:hypothetical protein
MKSGKKRFLKAQAKAEYKEAAQYVPKQNTDKKNGKLRLRRKISVVAV